MKEAIQVSKTQLTEGSLGSQDGLCGCGRACLLLTVSLVVKFRLRQVRSVSYYLVRKLGRKLSWISYFGGDGKAIIKHLIILIVKQLRIVCNNCFQISNRITVESRNKGLPLTQERRVMTSQKIVKIKLYIACPGIEF